MTDSSENITALLPCPIPWCGGEAQYGGEGKIWHYVECSECGCEGPAHKTEAEAIAAWNTRSQAMTDHSQPAPGWRPISSAPRDGTDIQARIPGHGEDNVIAWQVDAFMDSEGNPCGGWAFTTDQEPPDCWTDGICWEVNEDEVASVQPTHWKSLPPAPEQQP